MNDRTQSTEVDNKEGDAGIGDNSHGSELTLQTTTPVSTSCSTPSSSSDVKRAGGDSAAGGGVSNRRTMRSQSPIARTAGASSSRGRSSFSSTPESASRVVGKENSTRSRRADATSSRSVERGAGVDSIDGSGSSSRRHCDRKIDRNPGGESAKHISGKTTPQKVGSRRGEGRLRSGAESGGVTDEDGARSRPPESVMGRSLKRSSTGVARDVAHEKPPVRWALWSILFCNEGFLTVFRKLLSYIRSQHQIASSLEFWRIYYPRILCFAHKNRRAEGTKAPPMRSSSFEKQTRPSAGWR